MHSEHLQWAFWWASKPSECPLYKRVNLCLILGQFVCHSLISAYQQRIPCDSLQSTENTQPKADCAAFSSPRNVFAQLRSQQQTHSATRAALPRAAAKLLPEQQQLQVQLRLLRLLELQAPAANTPAYTPITSTAAYTPTRTPTTTAFIALPPLALSLSLPH